MNRNIERFKGKKYFSKDLFIYLNRLEEDFLRPHHYHDFIEITIIEEGSGFHYVNEKILKVQKGDLFVIPIGASHVFRPSSSNSKNKLIVCNIIFDCQVLKQIVNTAIVHGENSFAKWCTQLENNNIFDYLHLKDNHDTCLPLLRSMFVEFQEKQIGYSLILNDKLRELLIKLFRIKHQVLPKLNPKITSYAINEVLSYMHQNLHKMITLADVASLMNISESHFVRIFKKYTNQTFIEYLQNIRIEKSCHLLLHTDFSIKEVSYLVGYTNIDYFRELFLKKISVPPKEYRKKNTEL
ncbi:helix-turn-helix domain-containing protein [Bacillales bacterium AN1005]|uniref:AraC family transcriptional regulator n=1 Tax=Niallia taxi TaxID=2499688 RepID=UPI0021A77D57|nr:AraC family transcriptional regulator [Niallia taxi]MCT2346833.1 AraC family transcriptional regulator [Niallia taxi]